MQIITIPEKAKKENDLIAIPRKEYEALLRSRRSAKSDIVVKRSPSFRVAKKDEPFYDALDKELTEALREHYEGKSYGPFETAEETIRFLRRPR